MNCRLTVCGFWIDRCCLSKTLNVHAFIMVVATLTVRAVGLWGQDCPTRFWQIVSMRRRGLIMPITLIFVSPPPPDFRTCLRSWLLSRPSGGTKWRSFLLPSIYTTALHCVDLICFICPFIHIVTTANQELELCFESGPIQPQNA